MNQPSLSPESDIVVSIREDCAFALDQWNGDFNSVVKFPNDIHPAILAHAPSLIAVAACYGSVQCFRYLSHHRSDLKKTDDLWTPLSCFAAVSGNETILNRALQIPVQSNGRLNKTPLHYACEYGHLNIVKLLIEKHSYNINAQDYHGSTPLHLAIEFGHFEVANYLLSNPEIIPELEDKSGKSVLHKIAICNSCPKMLDLLPRVSIDINKLDHEGWSSVHYAADSNYLAFLESLDPIDIDITDGESPLHIAARRGFCAIVKWLLGVPGINVNACDPHNATPLHEAAYYSTPDVLTVLLASQEIDVNAVNDTGETALHAAVLKNQVENIRVLLADKRVDVNAKDFFLRTPLHVALRHRYMQSVMLLLECPLVNVNMRNRKSRTAFLIAAKRGYTEVVRKMLERKDVDVLWSDKNGVSAMIATESEEIKEMISEYQKQRRNPSI